MPVDPETGQVDYAGYSSPDMGGMSRAKMATMGLGFAAAQTFASKKYPFSTKIAAPLGLGSVLRGGNPFLGAAGMFLYTGDPLGALAGGVMAATGGFANYKFMQKTNVGKALAGNATTGAIAVPTQFNKTLIGGKVDIIGETRKYLNFKNGQMTPGAAVHANSLPGQAALPGQKALPAPGTQSPSGLPAIYNPSSPTFAGNMGAVHIGIGAETLGLGNLLPKGAANINDLHKLGQEYYKRMDQVYRAASGGEGIFGKKTPQHQAITGRTTLALPEHPASFRPGKLGGAPLTPGASGFPSAGGSVDKYVSSRMSYAGRSAAVVGSGPVIIPPYSTTTAGPMGGTLVSQTGKGALAEAEWIARYNHTASQAPGSPKKIVSVNQLGGSTGGIVVDGGVPPSRPQYSTPPKVIPPGPTPGAPAIVQEANVIGGRAGASASGAGGTADDVFRKAQQMYEKATGIITEGSAARGGAALGSELVSASTYIHQGVESNLFFRTKDFSEKELRQVSKYKGRFRPGGVSKVNAARILTRRRRLGGLRLMQQNDMTAFDKLLNQHNITKTGKSSRVLVGELEKSMGAKQSMVGGVQRVAKIGGTVMTAALVKDVAMMGVRGAMGTFNAVSNFGKSMRALEFGGADSMVSTAGASTERQRALQALQNSTMNARQFIGAEAALLHN